MNRFEWIAGKLHHYISDELRAVVESEHLDEYIRAAGINPDEVPLP